jgi:DNA-binding transcriptional MerR regulator
MKKLYYSIGEVAAGLQESVSLVRYWTNYFSRLLSPKRSERGNRFYTEEEVEILRELHYLIKEQGMTLDGAQDQILNNRKQLTHKLKVIETLKSIKRELQEVRKSL